MTGRAARAGVAIVFFVHGLLFSSWAAHIPHVKERLGLDDGTLGLALLGPAVGAVSAFAAAAYLVPRFGSRRVVQVALVGYCAAGPVVGITGSVAALVAALFVWGAFQGTLDIAMNTQAITVEHAQARPLMNGLHASWSIGAFAGAGVGAAAVAAGVALSPQLLVLGTVAVLIAGWRTTGMLLDAAPTAADESGQRPRRHFSAAMLALGLVAFASMLCEGAAADWSSVYLRDSLGSSAGVAGLGYTAFTLAMVAVRLLGNRLIARFGAPLLLPTLAMLATAGVAAALAIAAPAAAVAGFFLLGLGVGAVVPSMFSVAGRLPGVHPGFGVAVVSGVGWIGFLSGPPLIGQVAAATSLASALIIVPVLTAAIAVATRWVGQ